MRMKVYLIAALFAGCIFVSCKSNGFKENEGLYLMLYDLDNNAVSEAEVYMDEKFCGRTDVYGRFMFFFEEKERGENHLIRIKKEGYLSVEDKINYEASLFLYYRTGTFRQYFEKGEKFLEQGKYKKAEESAELALKIEKREDALYLKMLALIKAGEKEKAEKLKESFSEDIKRKEYLTELEEIDER